MRKTADEIRAEILEHGLRQDREFCASTTTPTPRAPPCWRPCSGSSREDNGAQLLAAEELTEHGFVLRYPTRDCDDGISARRTY